MKSTRQFLPVLVLVALLSCKQESDMSKEEQKSDSLGKQTETVIEKQQYDLVYTDTLPCKDCKGIKTTLQLSTHSNKFLLREEFLGTNIAANVLIGKFNTERGFEQDENATVYILNDDLPETEQQYFVRETGKDEVLLKLDNEKKKTNHSNFILTKVR